MSQYAYIVDGRVQELIPALVSVDGVDIPISDRYAPEFVAALVECADTVTLGMAYDGTSFSEYVPPVPSAAEILATNTVTRDALLAQAALSIAPLQDAVDLDMATDAEIALLKQWKQYRVAVNRADLTLASPAWPTAPSA